MHKEICADKAQCTPKRKLPGRVQARYTNQFRQAYESKLSAQAKPICALYLENRILKTKNLLRKIEDIRGQIPRDREEEKKKQLPEVATLCNEG